MVKKLERMSLGSSPRLMREGAGDTLGYMAFPREHRQWIRSNNVLEPIMEGIRRRTRVVGNFPDDKSASMLVAAFLRYLGSIRSGKQRYLDMDRLGESAKETQVPEITPSSPLGLTSPRGIEGSLNVPNQSEDQI